MKPKLWILDLSDPDRSFDDPALRSLAESGWTVAASFPAATQDHDRPRLALVLWPPAPRPAPIVTVAPAATWTGPLALALTLVGLAMAALGGLR